MSNVNLTAPNTYVQIINVFGWALIAVYALSMFVLPAIEANWDWSEIQRVWDRWQTLNTGMLAFLSSLIAFNISRYNAEQQRKRDFIAERSFLPEAFSELTTYCKSSMAVFVVAWRRAVDPADRCNTALSSDQPELPDQYREVFRASIRTAPPEFAEILSYLLVKIQVHHSRMTALFEEFEDSTCLIRHQSIVSYLYCIAEIQALINKNFQFTRGEESAIFSSELNWEDYRSALSVNDVEIDEIADLEGFIKRAITRRNSDD